MKCVNLHQLQVKILSAKFYPENEEGMADELIHLGIFD
jgi:hypothetical protein